ncbi:MAG: hypothetical protein OSJ70_01290 [Bacilli bacterium]|nr:hypothetical protein [Bacilli bacterium]
MELIRKEKNVILMSEKSEIESYSFDKEINFSGLINFLLNQNLSKQIEINDTLNDKSEAEENLINIIFELVDDYNSKVKEMKEFVDNLSNN